MSFSMQPLSFEKSETDLRPLESSSPNNNNNNNNGGSSRLPLRKRIAPVLKWQPVETPEEHSKSSTSYPFPEYPNPSPSSSTTSTTTTTMLSLPTTLQQPQSEGETTETDEDLQPKKAIDSENNKKKPLKKHFWATKEQDKRSPSWSEEEDRPVKKVKRGRPPLAQTKHNVMAPKPFITEPPATLPENNHTNNTLPRPSSSDNTLYCICKRPYDAPRFMIACDKCDQWFHGECIGISEKQGEFIDLYFCENCAKITGKKTSWKPKCANPACQRAARIGTHQGHLSKYCTDNCGMQVARARIELAEMKRRNALYGSLLSSNNPLSRGKLSSFADQDDRARLVRVRDEKQRAKNMIRIVTHKSQFLKSLGDAFETCGFDSRLSWPDTIWEKVNEQVDIDSIDKPYTVCKQNRKCNKHANWHKLKVAELEQERSEQFVILTMLERERQQIKARMKKRREESDLAAFLENGTICHIK